LVPAPAAIEPLQAILGKRLERLRSTGRGNEGDAAAASLPRLLLRLDDGQCTFVVWPETAQVAPDPELKNSLFVTSPWYAVEPGRPFFRLLADILPRPSAPRLADAAFHAAETGGATTVVVLTTGSGTDGSHRDMDGVARHLRSEGGTLHLWVFGKEPISRTAESELKPRAIKDWVALSDAVSELKANRESAP